MGESIGLLKLLETVPMDNKIAVIERLLMSLITQIKPLMSLVFVGWCSLKKMRIFGCALKLHGVGKIFFKTYEKGLIGNVPKN